MFFLTLRHFQKLEAFELNGEGIQKLNRIGISTLQDYFISNSHKSLLIFPEVIPPQ